MTTWEILEARGLDVERLAEKGWSVDLDGGERLVIPFHRNGNVVGHKFRRFDDPSRKWSAKWTNGPLAYNEDVLRDDSLLNEPLFICEGEIDCESIIAAGFSRAISVPNGCAGAGIERDTEVLETSAGYAWIRSLKALLTTERVREVILAVDGDEAGSRLLQELSVQLGRFRCKYLIYPKTRRTELGRERCKDLNEVLVEYGVSGIKKTVERAQWVAVPGVFKMSELPPLPESDVYDIDFPLLSENYKMRMGDFCVVTGVPSSGKSTWVNDLCCRVARRHKLTIAWCSLEQRPQDDHRRALRSWYLEKKIKYATHAEISEADRWIEQQHVFMVPTEDEDTSLDWLLDAMEAAVVRHGCRVIVIDPFNELDSSAAKGESETNYIGRFIRTMKRFARKFQVHVIVVAHPAKLLRIDGQYPRPTLYDINGSSHWYNKAEIGIIVHRKDDSTVIWVQKSRYHETIGRPGEVEMAYVGDDRRYRELSRIS